MGKPSQLQLAIDQLTAEIVVLEAARERLVRQQEQQKPKACRPKPAIVKDAASA